MTNYEYTKSLWKDWYKLKPKYSKSTNSNKHIEITKKLISEYGNQINSNNLSFCELGIGSGRNLFYFHEQFPKWKYFGNDINENILNEIKSIYPNLLNNVFIQVEDTLLYLNKISKMDIIFTYGHLMHIPPDTINQICNLINLKCKKYIILYEAYINEDKKISLKKKSKYTLYRFERDYENMFPDFKLENKKIYTNNKNISQCEYFFIRK